MAFDCCLDLVSVTGDMVDGCRDRARDRCGEGPSLQSSLARSESLSKRIGFARGGKTLNGSQSPLAAYKYSIIDAQTVECSTSLFTGREMRIFYQLT